MDRDRARRIPSAAQRNPADARRYVGGAAGVIRPLRATGA
ncbi:hypothetical protein OKW43_005983 [Paraburkholderia sp. WC7.3g]